MTNNPSKLEALEAHGIGVERVALEIAAGPENASYLQTKVRRMRHLLELDSMFDPAGGLIDPLVASEGSGSGAFDAARALTRVNDSEIERPAISLSYAQSLDGSITIRSGRSLTLSCPEAMEMTHQLRARHHAILVGIETVLADDPRLTVRLVEGPNPQAIVLDSQLRTPLESQLLADPPKAPWIATVHSADRERQKALEENGAVVIRVGADAEGRVDLMELLPELSRRGIESVMVEGGSRVITSFLRADVVDRLAVTITPVLVGGLGAVGDLGEPAERGVFPRLVAPRIRWVGSNLVLVAEVARRKNRAEVDDQPVGLDGSLL
jgi:3,4-dihydroxy 2-butanone 4-phosphate synthase/GTP cyclohydrolase II